MFNNFMFQFDVSIEGVLGTVETIAVGVGTGQTLHDIFFAPSYWFFGVLGLSFLNFAYFLEHFEHFTVLFLSLFDLLLEEGLSFGQEGQFFREVDGGGKDNARIGCDWEWGFLSLVV